MLRHRTLLHGCALLPALAFLLFPAAFPARAATPEWIWHSNGGQAPADGEVRYFRKVLDLDADVQAARILVTADNHFVLFINGQQVGKGDDWQDPQRYQVAAHLRRGKNLVAIQASNDSGAAALLVKLDINLKSGRNLTVVSDASWNTQANKLEDWEKPDFDMAGWFRAQSIAKLGAEPWGDITQPRPTRQARRDATPAESLKTLPGFEVTLVRNAEPQDGSWVCMTIDPKGRLIVSPQDARQQLLRFTLGSDGSIARREVIELGVGEAMGLLHADESLYANAKGPAGTGLYRLFDTDGDDQYDRLKFLHPMKGGGEHGPHGVVKGLDSRIYVMNGNHTQIPEGTVSDSPHRGYAEDQLLPRDWDGNGHARGVMAPGGHIARSDSEGQSWELMLAGFRNSYDFDQDDEGEMFTFDSDMEWDWGMPWYRPTVVYHCVSGADFGWRSGTGKWPWYYPDATPPTAEIGIGSPTGVVFGRGARFPASYQRALYIMDWTYGRIIAVHLKPKGASFVGTPENFVSGRPLNVTDMVVGHDGAMYFTTGGRGTQSGLYRVRYTGTEDTSRVRLVHFEGREARALRRRLEAFHGKEDPAALDAAWPHLDSGDRFLRTAARVAVESQPLEKWQQRALDETATQASLTALLALARCGKPEVEQALLESLSRLSPDNLTADQRLQALRVLGLTFIRLGAPSPSDVADLLAVVDPLYPSDDPVLNRELSRLLVYLEAPNVAGRTLDLLEASNIQEDQIHYIVALRTLKEGWSMDERRRYFSWFNRERNGLTHPPELLQWFADVDRDYTDGASFPKFLANFKKEAEATLTKAERTALAGILEGKEKVPVRVAMAPRAFVKEWTMADLEPHLAKADMGRSFARGKEMFTVAQCAACHKFGNDGGATGQELTAVASRYTRPDILDSILHPSKVVSEQYQNTAYYLKDGEDVTGRVVDEEDGMLVIEVDPIAQTRVKVKATDVERKEASTISPMPEGLVNSMSLEEILDLLAYLESGGRQDRAAFKP